jgi:hypothetical protein
MSDTASKVAGLENRYQQMESQFTTSFLRLEVIISGLGFQSLAANTGSLGSIQTPVPSSVNLPAPDSAGGFINNKAAGSG